MKKISPKSNRLNTSILVTGSAGFIGQHLVESLIKRGYKVFAKGRSDGDVRKIETWKKYPKADCVVHLAGLTFVPDSWINPELFISSNSVSTNNSLEYCRTNDAKLVFPSTYMYSTNSFESAKESEALKPVNPYALSKFLGESLCRYYAEFFGVRVAILRPFNVYGVGQSDRFLVPSVIRQARLGDEIRVQDSKPSRDYLYIDDLIEAIRLVVETEISFDIFNLGTGKSYSVEALINVLEQVVGRGLRIVSAKTERQSEINFTRADISHATELLRWNPQWSLLDGLSEIWNKSIDCC